MTIGKQLQSMSDGIDEVFKAKFIKKTQKLLTERVTETHTFLDASLAFESGKAVWRQDLPMIDFNKRQSATNPLMNPTIPVQTAKQAYKLFKGYYVSAWLAKGSAGYQQGISDLERYCST